MHDMSTTSVQLFGLTKSKTTRKAQRFFSDRRISVHFVDCKVRPPAPGELKRWVQRFGAEALLDPGSKSYKEQGLQYVSASDDDWIGRMTDDPSILRLPLGRVGNELTVGDDPDGWKRLADALGT
jgi:arsenate reductase (glutaredoxin)